MKNLSGTYQEATLFPARQSGLHPADIGAIEGHDVGDRQVLVCLLQGYAGGDREGILEGEKLGTKGKFGLGGCCNSPSKTNKERKTGFPATRCWFPQSGTLWTWEQERPRSFLLVLVVL